MREEFVKGKEKKETSIHSSELLQGEQRCPWKGAGAAPLGSSAARKGQKQVVLLQGGHMAFLLSTE